MSRIGIAPSAPVAKYSDVLANAPLNASRVREGSSKLIVLLVVEPGLDGVFRHVEGLVDYLLREGVGVHLAYSSYRSGAAMLGVVERVRESGGQVVDLRVTNTPQLGDLRALLRLTKLIRRVNPDVIHSHSSKAGALARFLAFFFRKPRYVYTPHAYYGLGKPRWLRVWVFNQVERWLGRVGETIAISQDEADFAAHDLGVRRECLRVIHNPVDSTRFKPATPEQRRDARAKLGIPQDATVLAMIGRMCWQKDPETGYHAVAPVCAANPKLYFLHLGWGKWKGYLLNLAQRLGYGDQLRLVDYVDDPRSFYHAIDGVLVGSRYEAGWPLVFLEAMACNLPVVAATCVGMSDVGKAGLSHVWTFAPENRGACTASVQAWLDHGADQPLGINHRAFALEQLTPDRCFGAVLMVYRKTGALVRVTPVPR